MKKGKIAEAKHLQFNLLPYISLNDTIKIGNALLWPFYRYKDQYIKDTLIRTQIEKFLKQYVDYTSARNPLKNPTIVSYKSPDNFIILKPKQKENLRDAIIILCFSTIIKNNNYSTLSSDDFLLLNQNFTAGDDGIAPYSGSLIRIKNSGRKINEIFFATPFYINQGWKNLSYNNKLFEALEKLQKNRKNQEFYRRIITALEWVAYSYTNSENFNHRSRIVMMATAFEVLLDGFDGKFVFMKKIGKFTCSPLDHTKKKRSTRNIMYEREMQPKEFSFKEWWAYDFYILRNKIVHGQEVENKNLRNRKGKQYFLLAIKFFEECLKKLLEENGYYDYDSTDEILWAGIYSEI